MSVFVVPLGHGGNDSVSLLQDMRYPPSKSWLVVEVRGRGILSHFNSITFLQLQRCCTIFPFYTKISTLRCLPYLCVSSNVDIHVSALHCSPISIVSNNVL
jgi:hypothetical protein